MINILIIVLCVFIVGGVVFNYINKKRKGISSCSGCSGCSSNCGQKYSDKRL